MSIGFVPLIMKTNEPRRKRILRNATTIYRVSWVRNRPGKILAIMVTWFYILNNAFRINFPHIRIFGINRQVQRCQVR
jgi:hypothetical protein